MNLPKKISPCPIMEAIFEVRFDSDLPEDAIFGVVYNHFKIDYPELERLPILQLPEQIRSHDPNLIYSPHYKLKKDQFILQIGPKVFSLVNIREYCGWKSFSEKIYDILDDLSKLGIVKKIKRIGLRYINVFNDLNIYEKSNLEIKLNKRLLVNNQINFTTKILSGNCINQLKIVNEAEVLIGKEIFKGSIIDIDAVLLKYPDNALVELNQSIEQAHNEEKKLFFSLLKKDLIDSLNPIF